MLVICPLSACSSYEKRDQFLSMLSDIAVVTQANEPKTISYAWFSSTGDNDEVPNHYVRGFEVYEEEEALVGVHRSSTEYKKMRGSVIPDKIMEKPTDLRFLQPTGTGFMNRSKTSQVFSPITENGEMRSWVVVLEIKPFEGKKELVSKEISEIASKVLENEPEVLSFWELEYLPQYSDNGITLFSRFKNKKAYDNHKNSPLSLEVRRRITSMATIRTSRWIETGIGFIGR